MNQKPGSQSLPSLVSAISFSKLAPTRRAAASLIAAASALAWSASVQAANIQMSLQYGGSFAPDGVTPLPGSPPAPLFAQSAPHPGFPGAVFVPGAYHKFDVYMALTNTGPGEDFQTVTWDFVRGPGVMLSDVGWVGEFPTHDPAGPVPNGPIYSNNGDFGPNSLDLKAVAVIANHANNYVRVHDTQPGEVGGTLGFPTKVGSAYVFWNGTFGPDGKSWLALSYPANTGNAHSTVIGTVGTAQPPNFFSVGPRVEWVEVHIPPFTVDDLFLGGRLPGQIFTGGPLPTSDEDHPDSVVWSLVSLIGPDGPEVGATVDPLTGVFTWHSAPTDSRGAYTATIQGINAGPNAGTDTGLLTFNTVPEPASITLLGMATIGACGFMRRFIRK